MIVGKIMILKKDSASEGVLDNLVNVPKLEQASETCRPSYCIFGPRPFWQNSSVYSAASTFWNLGKWSSWEQVMYLPLIIGRSSWNNKKWDLAAPIWIVQNSNSRL